VAACCLWTARRSASPPRNALPSGMAATAGGFGERASRNGCFSRPANIRVPDRQPLSEMHGRHRRDPRLHRTTNGRLVTWWPHGRSLVLPSSLAGASARAIDAQAHGRKCPSTRPRATARPRATGADGNEQSAASRCTSASAIHSCGDDHHRSPAQRPILRVRRKPIPESGRVSSVAAPARAASEGSGPAPVRVT
jgi:hypothetical protein